MKLYEQLADEIELQIRNGVCRDGEKLQSIRQTSQQRQVSITTVLKAYLLLESRGLVASRPQSGYLVTLPATARDETAASAAHRPAPPPVSSAVDVSQLVLATLRAISADDAVPLGSPYPDGSVFPYEKLNRYAYVARHDMEPRSLGHALPPGHPLLIRQIAKRYLDKGMVVDPNEIIVTVGATEAINLCLQAVAKPGDVVAVESPTFYAMLHAIERMGMRVIEIPTHPEFGIDVQALERIAQEQPIAACMVMPNFQNPMGFQMPDERKRALVNFATRADMPIIENGVYNELHYSDTCPTSLKSYDREGLVLHCSSFSKTLTSTYRIGWALAGRYRDQVEKLKFLNTLTTSALPQIAIARYLERCGYDKHLRRVRRLYAQNAKLMAAVVLRFFPEGTRVSTPRGGYVLWVELPEQVDAMRLYELALERGITIGPGYMFSVSNRYRHFIRLNFSTPWSSEVEQAVITVAKLASDCMG